MNRWHLRKTEIWTVYSHLPFRKCEDEILNNGQDFASHWPTLVGEVYPVVTSAHATELTTKRKGLIFK